MYLSASSRMIILCRPGGKVTFFWANILILFRTTSMPLHSRRYTGQWTQWTDRSSDAFNSSTASFTAVPSNWFSKHKILVVFPIPGDPWCDNQKILVFVNDYRDDDVRHVPDDMTFQSENHSMLKRKEGVYFWERRASIADEDKSNKAFCKGVKC